MWKTTRKKRCKTETTEKSSKRPQNEIKNYIILKSVNKIKRYYFDANGSEKSKTGQTSKIQTYKQHHSTNLEQNSLHKRKRYYFNPKGSEKFYYKKTICLCWFNTLQSLRIYLLLVVKKLELFQLQIQ